MFCLYFTKLIKIDCLFILCYIKSRFTFLMKSLYNTIVLIVQLKWELYTNQTELKSILTKHRTEIDLIYLLRPTLITLRKTCNEYRCLVCLWCVIIFINRSQPQPLEGWKGEGVAESIQGWSQAFIVGVL